MGGWWRCGRGGGAPRGWRSGCGWRRCPPSGWRSGCGLRRCPPLREGRSSRCGGRGRTPPTGRSARGCWCLGRGWLRGFIKHQPWRYGCSSPRRPVGCPPRLVGVSGRVSGDGRGPAGAPHVDAPPEGPLEHGGAGPPHEVGAVQGARDQAQVGGAGGSGVS